MNGKLLGWGVLLLLAGGIAGPARAAPTHYGNAFASASRWYVNPAYTQLAYWTAEQVPFAIGMRMAKAGEQPTAVWLDTLQGVGTTVRTHLDQALAAGSDLITFVVYDLPGRDCAALASNGELPATREALDTYRTQFIDQIAAEAHRPEYEGIRVVFIIEPDSLPNLVTNVNGANPTCQAVADQNLYVEGIQYAVNTLASAGHGNVYVYLDVAHSAWMGWNNLEAGTDGLPGLVQVLDTVAGGLDRGPRMIDGFVSNISNYQPTVEPYMTASLRPFGQGTPRVLSASFYDTNDKIDEVTYLKALWTMLTSSKPYSWGHQAWPRNFGMVIDTSRNGWGGAARPSGPAEGAADIHDFVNRTKVDQRQHRGQWCNQIGAGVGELPRAARRDDPPALVDAHFEAFLWVKPPGMSDGSNEVPAANGKRPDPACQPDATMVIGDVTVPTNAMPGAPLAGEWFPWHFLYLVMNAYPPLY